MSNLSRLILMPWHYTRVGGWIARFSRRSTNMSSSNSRTTTTTTTATTIRGCHESWTHIMTHPIVWLGPGRLLTGGGNGVSSGGLSYAQYSYYHSQHSYLSSWVPPFLQSTDSAHMTSLRYLLERWAKNGRKLYRRRMIELAVAAMMAAVTRERLRTQMEGYHHHPYPDDRHRNSGGGGMLKPSDWSNWQRKDWTDELMASLGRTKLARVWSATQRIATLTALATPLVVLYPLSYVSTRATDWCWSYSLWGIEKAGPTFIKLAQWATTRHDLFSPEFCHYFGKLRSETRGHSWTDTQRILQQDLGSLANRVVMEENPIGSGCIAQVYRGKLTEAIDLYPAGTEVAIKIQHPGVWYKVCVDFYVMGKLARFLEAIPGLNLQFLSIVDSVKQFRDVMLPQLDLTLEAQNLQRFNRDFAGNSRVSFPRPIQTLTTERILTETFIHGKPILEYTSANDETRKELACLGLETTLQMIFLNDFLHGDLHPGNILVSRDPKTNDLRLHLLDCGITVEMGPEQHVNVVKILGAFVRQDGYKAGKLMVDAASVCQASELDIELFAQGIMNIVEADKDNNFVERVGDYIIDICYLACTKKVKLEPSFVSAALAVEIMEGIASALYPEMKVIPVALPLIVKAEMMHRLPKFHLW